MFVFLPLVCPIQPVETVQLNASIHKNTVEPQNDFMAFCSTREVVKEACKQLEKHPR